VVNRDLTNTSLFLIYIWVTVRNLLMKKRELIKQHLSQLNLQELLRYRLLFCTGEPNEDLELNITDLFNTKRINEVINDCEGKIITNKA